MWYLPRLKVKVNNIRERGGICKGNIPACWLFIWFMGVTPWTEATENTGSNGIL